MRILPRALGALVIGLMLSTGHATPVTWTLNNVNFSDGGAAFGSFVYDATTNNVLGVSIFTTPGGSYAGQNYSTALFGAPPGPAAYSPFTLGATTTSDQNIGDIYLTMFFSSALTNSGGTIALNSLGRGNELQCTYNPVPGRVCAGTAGPNPTSLRQIISGSVTAPLAAVPVPATAWLFGSALGVMGWLRRKAR